MGRPILMICTLYDVFLHKELPFRGHMFLAQNRFFNNINHVPDPHCSLLPAGNVDQPWISRAQN